MPISATPQIRPKERFAPNRPVTRALLTRAGERAMRAELEQLRKRLEHEFTERLREARAFGGSHENDDYLQIKEEEAVLASRIRQLETLLESAEIVDTDSARRGVVAIGSRVKVRDTISGAVREHRLTGGFEPADPSDVSVNSPVGQALLGRSRGETVAVQLPNNRTAMLEIVSVRNAPKARRARA